MRSCWQRFQENRGSFLEKIYGYVDHAHFQEEQRAYYQGMIEYDTDIWRIWEFLEKKENKVKETAYAYWKIVQTGWKAYRQADHPVLSRIIQK